MRVPQRRSAVTSLVLLGFGIALISGSAWAQSESTPQPPEPQSPPPLDGPTTDLAPIPSAADAPRTGSATDEDKGQMTTRETLPAPDESADSSRVYVRKAPPSPIVERPSGPRPDRRAQWIAGHWAWDASRDDFVWVGGSWQIPPAGSTWVAGRWRHDPAGWYWVSGTWSRLRDQSAAGASAPAWRTTGPPNDHPDDTPAPRLGPTSSSCQAIMLPRPGIASRGWPASGPACSPAGTGSPRVGPTPEWLGLSRRPLGSRPGHGRGQHRPPRPPPLRRPSFVSRTPPGGRRVGACRARRRSPPAASRYRDGTRPPRGGRGCRSFRCAR